MKREYGVVLQDISMGGYGGGGGASGTKRRVDLSKGNTSSQIIRRNNEKIKELEKRVLKLEEELIEARKPTKKYYCKVKE